MKRNYSTLLVLLRHFICILPSSNLYVYSSSPLFPMKQFEFQQTFESNEFFQLGCFSGISTQIHTYVHTWYHNIHSWTKWNQCSNGVKSEMFSFISFLAALDKEKQQLPWLIPREKESTSLNNFKTYCTHFFGPN